MERKLYSCKNTCNGNCLYCFEKQLVYPKFEILDELSLTSDCTVLYPNCDGDFFDESFNELICKLDLLEQYAIVSISTKRGITNDQIKKLASLNKKMINSGRGFVKISLSFSCISQIDELEVNTLSYCERLSLAKTIVSNGIRYSTIIKPILPFVPIEDYFTIVRDTISYSANYVLGDLYVNLNSDFYKKYVCGKYKTFKKSISWLENGTTWDVVENQIMKDLLSKYITEKGGKVFESDVDYLRYINAR